MLWGPEHVAYCESLGPLCDRELIGRDFASRSTIIKHWLLSLMRRKVSSIVELILESPALRTLFSVVIPVATGILSGSFIVEITASNGLDWRSFYASQSFYGLVFICWVMYVFNRACYRHEKQVHRFLDSDYCIAYMRSKCLPEAAERYKELIRSGHGGEMEQAMEELERILR